jgi:DNA repair protein RAD5
MGTGVDEAGKVGQEGETSVTIGKVDLASSTKLRALVRRLEVLRLEDPLFKALVFSQFTSFLGESVWWQ